MQIKTKTISVKTSKPGPEFIDITEKVLSFVQDSGLKNGLVAICSQHTTAAIKINEHEPLLIGDMEKFLKKIAKPNIYYAHNDFTIRTENMTANESKNGHSHCQNLLLSASETRPVVDGELQLGRWQRIFLVELDHARDRDVIVQIMGE
ncbi:MAG: secondary thiamine-phosphate synthase enzyme YjbQ [bacterium]|nr:secondary thiamine-phosphate synthase enzyme YjbQ [bacterium]